LEGILGNYLKRKEAALFIKNDAAPAIDLIWRYAPVNFLMMMFYDYYRTTATVNYRAWTMVVYGRSYDNPAAMMVNLAVYWSSNWFMIYYRTCSYPGINYNLCFCGAKAANSYNSDYCDFN